MKPAASLLLTVSVALCSSVNAGLVGHWAGDGNAQDSVAANDGTLFGNTSYVPGKIGDAFSFDGASLVSVPSVPAYQFGTGDFSVSLWVRFDALQHNNDGFLHKDDFGVGTTKGWLFNVANLLGGVGMEVRDWPAGQDVNARQSVTAFAINTWYSFIGVRQGNAVELYVNGQLASTVTSAAPVDVSNDINLDIGALSVGSRQYFNGAVDEVQLYNHALSGSEIEAIADVPEGSTWAAVITLLGLVGWQRGRCFGLFFTDALRLDRRAAAAAVVLIALLGVGRSAKAQGTYFETTFDDSLWSATPFVYGNGGTVSASQVTTGGNPGPYRSIMHTVNSAGGLPSIVHGYHFSSLMTYEFQPGAGISTIDYSIDYRTLGNAQVGLGLAVRQSGTLFLGGYAIAIGGAWQTRSVAGLQAGDFRSPVAGILDFSDTAPPIEIGFVTANSTNPFYAGYSATIQVDNLVVTSHSVPEASTYAAVITLLGSVGWQRGRWTSQRSQ